MVHSLYCIVTVGLNIGLASSAARIHSSSNKHTDRLFLKPTILTYEDSKTDFSTKNL